jgi:hypothetical protein
MSKHVKIRLFTEPTRHIRHDLPLTPTPYQKVVGVQLGEQKSWLAEYTDAPHEVTYSVPRIIGHRLLWYFNRNLGKDAIKVKPDISRNCFHYGLWMARGIAHSSRYVANEILYREARYTPPVTAPSRAGQLTVIRCVQDIPLEPVLHGLVSMGEGIDAYTQIMTRGGDLGITSLGEALAYRRTDEYRDVIAASPYGIDPKDWEVGHYCVPESLQPGYLS